MSATTLVVPAEALAAEQWGISGDAHHHLFRVKRLVVGDRLRLTDGVGHARFAEILAITKRDALARLGDAAPSNEPALEIELVVAPPKPERAAWLVEKATEVGVTAVRFVATERGARSLGAAQLERLRRVAVAAVEQSGRARLPEIASAADLPSALATLSAADTEVRVLDAAGARWPGAAAGGRVAVLIGPEGGWSPAESARFDRLALRRCSLGERILRVETAAIVTAGLLLAPASGD